MFTTANLRQKISFTRDFVVDQTWDNINRLLGTGDIGFDVALGLGVATDTSIMVAFGVGGFDDQRVTAVCRYTSTTAIGDEDFGILMRFITNHNPDSTYYYFRIDGQDAKITKVVDTSFTTLTQDPFPLAQDTDVTITSSILGSALSVNFNDGTNSVTLSTTDTDITSGGLIGFRTMSSTGYIKSITIEEYI